MTSYIDIDTSPEAIHEDEEIIEAVQNFSSQVAVAIISDVKNDVSTFKARVQNVFDTAFPFVKVWRNDIDIFWSDIQHLGIAVVLFAIFFVLLAPWKSQKPTRKTSSWIRLEQESEHVKGRRSHPDGKNSTIRAGETLENRTGRMSWWWGSWIWNRRKSSGSTRHDMKRSWSLFSSNDRHCLLERSKSASNITLYQKNSSTQQTALRQSYESNNDPAAMREDEESEEEKFAKRWSYISRTHYGCLVLPPQCKRVDKPKIVSRLPGVSTTIKSSNIDESTQEDGDVTLSHKNTHTSSERMDHDAHENPKTRLVKYAKHFSRLLALIVVSDFPSAVRTLIQWKNAALTVRQSNRRVDGTSLEDDDDEDASVASSATAQSTSKSSLSSHLGKSDIVSQAKETKAERFMRGEKTPVLANKTKSSRRTSRRTKTEVERRMDHAPPIPGIHDQNSPGIEKNPTPLEFSDQGHVETGSQEWIGDEIESGEGILSECNVGAEPKAKTLNHARYQNDEGLQYESKSFGVTTNQNLDPGSKISNSNDTRDHKFTDKDTRDKFPGTPPLEPLRSTSPTFHTPLRDLHQVDAKLLLNSSATKIPNLGPSMKARDALDPYRVSTFRQVDLPGSPYTDKRSYPPESTIDDSQTMSFSSLEAPEHLNTSSNSNNAYFFETATSRQSLSRMNVEVPLVPDKHGYLGLGDEFLSNTSCTPLLVFVNSRSGPQQGHLLITQLRALLNPIQVWDLADGGPREILESFSVFSRLRILVCGGDGTVSWIVSTIEAMKLQKWPPIAILPLGTGNDLAQIHGWGSGYNNESLIGVLDQVADSYVSWLDRWEMTIENKKGKVKEVKSFFNYLGVGADAQAALQVHMLRENQPELFFSRLVNKAWYGVFGAEDIVKASSVNLPNDVTLIADGVEVPLPEDSQGIILLNIDSYSGGAKLWANGHKVLGREAPVFSRNLSATIPMKRSKSLDALKGMRVDSVEDLAALGALTDEEKFYRVTSCDRPSSCQDGFLDIVSIRGPFHLGQIRVGISTAEKLCQCREATIHIRRKHSVQIDGEPWRQNPCIVRVRKKKNAAIMLHRSADESNGVESEMAKLLDWGEERGLIDSNVHAALMKEYSRRIESKTRERRDKSGDKSLFSLKRAIQSGGNLNGRKPSIVKAHRATNRDSVLAIATTASGVTF